MTDNRTNIAEKHSEAIRERLLMVLQDKCYDELLLRQIETLTRCSFAPKMPSFDQLILRLSNTRESICSVLTGYRIWQMVNIQDRTIIFDRFVFLFNPYVEGVSIGDKSVIFCEFFLKDFIPVLEEYGMELIRETLNTTNDGKGNSTVNE